MNTPPPVNLTAEDVTIGLRVAAAGSYPAEAAVELLIRHQGWLMRPEFVATCVYALDDEGQALAVDWAAVVENVAEADAPPADRTVARIAAQLGADPFDPEAAQAVSTVGSLALLLASLNRSQVDLVLAAISHAAGTHDHVEHIGEPGEAGEWRVTPTSPRLRPGPLHRWPLTDSLTAGG
jgi:hypothetical protein